MRYRPVSQSPRNDSRSNRSRHVARTSAAEHAGASADIAVAEAQSSNGVFSSFKVSSAMRGGKKDSPATGEPGASATGGDIASCEGYILLRSLTLPARQPLQRRCGLNSV